MANSLEESFARESDERDSMDYPLNWTRSDGEEVLILELFSVRLTFTVLYSLVFFPCVIGNFIVLLVVTTHWRMKHITKFCLANLALADLCVGLFCVYQNLLTYFTDDWILGSFLCKMYQFISGTSHTASVLTLMSVCVERYLAILQPLRCRQILTTTRLKMLVAAVWLASGIYCSPRLYYMGIVQVPRWNSTEDEMICTGRRSLYSSRTFDMINSLLLFILPLILMGVLYTRVGLVLWGKTGQPLTNSAPIITNTFPNNEGDSSETESFGIYPEERVIKIPIGKKHEFLKKSLEVHSQYHYRCSSSSTPTNNPPRYPQRYHSSPDLRNLKKVTRPVLAKSSLYPSDMNLREKLEIGCWHGRKSIHYGRKSETNLRTFQSGLNALRRKYFLKKIQAQKRQLEIRRHFLGARNEWKVRRSVVKMLLVIVGTFAFCNFPFHLRKFLLYWWPYFDRESVWGTLSLPISHLFMYGNSAVNPIIYAIMSGAFRASMKDVIRCRWKKPHRAESNYIIPANDNTLVTTSTSARSKTVKFSRHLRAVDQV